LTLRGTRWATARDRSTRWERGRASARSGRPSGVEAFGVNAIVYAPGYEGFLHYHDEQDELYFVHRGTATFEVDGEEFELGPGGVVHVQSTTARRVSNPSDEELVMLVVGGKGGYVGRDGQLVDVERDLPRRQAFGRTD
jgi:mannose-6-phosphate isomerase-like protein (cupin superfamily)